MVSDPARSFSATGPESEAVISVFPKRFVSRVAHPCSDAEALDETAGVIMALAVRDHPALPSGPLAAEAEPRLAFVLCRHHALTQFSCPGLARAPVKQALTAGALAAPDK